MKPNYHVTYAPLNEQPSTSAYTSYKQAMHLFDTLKGCYLIHYAYVTQLDDIRIEVIEHYIKEYDND